MQIYKEQTGSLVAICAFGTTCTASVTASVGNNFFVAFIGDISATPPPDTTVASANALTFWLNPPLVRAAPRPPAAPAPPALPPKPGRGR
jgi:hypothetical protein